MGIACLRQRCRTEYCRRRGRRELYNLRRQLVVFYGNCFSNSNACLRYERIACDVWARLDQTLVCVRVHVGGSLNIYLTYPHSASITHHAQHVGCDLIVLGSIPSTDTQQEGNFIAYLSYYKA